MPQDATRSSKDFSNVFFALNSVTSVPLAIANKALNFQFPERFTHGGLPDAEVSAQFQLDEALALYGSSKDRLSQLFGDEIGNSASANDASARRYSW